MFDIKQTTQYMSICVTHQCNMACPYCVDQYRGRPERLSLDDLDKAIDLATRMNIKDILITGGEPTLHPRIREICKRLKQKMFNITLTTNYTRPLVAARLGGAVDNFNISWHDQLLLPDNRDRNSKSDYTLHAVIHSEQLESQKKLDSFIDQYEPRMHLKFSTLTACNAWAAERQSVPYLDKLDCEWVVLFNEMLGQVYRGHVIKRYDRVINHHAAQSIKFHVDGTWSYTREHGESEDRDATT